MGNHSLKTNHYINNDSLQNQITKCLELPLLRYFVSEPSELQWSLQVLEVLDNTNKPNHNNNKLLMLTLDKGFGGNAELQLGPFGSVQGGANIGLPTSGSTLLTNAVIGLGALSLINTIATVVTPYLTKNDATEDATTEKPAESRAMKALEDTVVESLLAAKKKYL